MIYIANWKMNMSMHDAMAFCQNNRDALAKLTEEATIVLCPSFPAIIPMVIEFEHADVGIAIGAQNCSWHKSGAYTGEVSAQMLDEAGCLYCIVGHSERRTHFGETNEMVAQKVGQLLESNIEPIICIGESKTDYEQGNTFTTLEAQLGPIRTELKKHTLKTPICIAYEPVWSIGTGITPDNTYIKEVFSWIKDYLEPINAHLIYGGSVTPQNAPILKKVAYLEGFLIGGASLDFQKFKNIVL